MIEVNGVRILEEGDDLREKVPESKNWPPFPEGQVIFPYGAKVVEIDGKKYWQAADQQDFVEVIALVNGVSSEKLRVDIPPSSDCTQFSVLECRNIGNCLGHYHCYLYVHGNYCGCSCGHNAGPGKIELGCSKGNAE